MKKLIVLSLLITTQTTSIEYFEVDKAEMPTASGQISFDDLNGDGYKDIFSTGLKLFAIDNCPIACPPVVLHNEPAKIWINNKDGGFIEKDFSPNATIKYFNIVIADIDNDNDNDIINSSGEIMINDGEANFSMASAIDITTDKKPFFAEDLDNDNVLELIKSGRVYKQVNSNPIEYHPTSIDFNWSPERSIEVADFNADGFKDVLTYDDTHEIEILFNDGTGNITNANKLTLPYFEQLKLIHGDTDNDGDVDIILSENRLLVNNLDEGFELRELITGYSSFEGQPILNYIPKKLVDINNDEFMDIFLLLKLDNSNVTNVVFLGNSNVDFNTLEPIMS